MRYLESIAEPSGVLPPWNLWWGDDVLPHLVTDPALQHLVLVDMPRLHIDWFHDQFEHPALPGTSRYLRLSPAYDDQARIAETNGFETIRIDGTHLSHLTEPARVVTVLDL